MKKIISAFLLLSLLLSLTSCSAATASAHTKAIEAAFEKLAADHALFSHFKCEELKSQVREQAKEEQQEDKEKAAYEIKVLVPDLAKVNADMVKVDMSDKSLTYTSATTYANSYKEQANDQLKALILADKDIDWAEVTVPVTLTKGDKGWTAKVEEAAGQKLADAARREIWRTSAEHLRTDKEYHAFYIKSNVKTQLEDIFPEQAYRSAVSVEDIKANGADGFKVTLKYHDPETVYSGAMDAFYKTYAAAGKTQYTAVSAQHGNTHLKDNFGEYFKALVAQEKDQDEAAVEAGKKQAELLVALDEELNIEVTEGLDELRTQVVAKRDALMKAAVDKINNEFVIKEQARPKTSLLSGANSGSPIAVKSSANVSDKHIDFQKEDGTSVLKAFIKSGESLTVRLPAGSYRLVQGWGDKWYGNDHSFGPNGTYQQSRDILTVRSNYTYTLTLYGVSDGNMPSQGIQYPY